MSTIAAISTPFAQGGISVIRISGEQALEIADKVFFAKSGKKLKDADGYTCLYGNIKDKDTVIDTCIAAVFRAPHSYTGENVAELSCHGGIFLTKTVLRMVLEAGAMPAEPGEFTKRAFLNGKLGLTEAEAVMDIICADNAEELLCAGSLHSGDLYQKIRGLCGECIDISADLAAWADFPEEDIPEVSRENLSARISGVLKSLKNLASTYDYGLILKEGIRTVIIGKPNVGKSTLMNYLSGFERSIVCDIPGTTRDIIEESVAVGSFKLRISDTAGIRDTEDKIEKIGVERAFSKLEEAQLILAVFDLSAPLDKNDFELLEKIRGRNAVVLLNKNDCAVKYDTSLFQQYVDNVVEISAKNKKGMKKIISAIENIFNYSDIKSDKHIYVNERQKICLESAIKSLENASEAVNNGEFNDIIAVIIDECAQHLLSLTGENVSEAVVNEVFSKFCVGK